MKRPGRGMHGIVLLLACASLACAPAPRMGDSVHIAEESAIIVWDAASNTQHFIRRASFETKAKDFGFLVPTPTVPTLEEVDDEAFEYLEQLVLPVYKPAVMPDGTSVKSAPPRAAVRVIATARIAGFEAAVLEADDAALLDSWLKDHGYASTPELLEWYRHYIAAKWIITAFKIPSDVPEARLRTSAVKMSFRTEAPFFPYREPASARAGSEGKRLLRIYFLGEHRVDGWIGKGGTWPARVLWAGPLDGGHRERILKHAQLPAIVAGARYLTVFDDRSSPRPGVDDLFFALSSNQSEVRPGGPGGMDSPDFFLVLLILAAVLAIATGACYLLYRLFRMLVSARRR